MELKLYDTLTREKRVFTPLDPSNVRMYVCGPTVYDFAHIGNARPVIVFDVLFRLLRHLYGAEHVTYVRNITDVDDKINARAAEEYPALPLNEAIRRVTEKTDRQFHEDVAALGCLPPTFEPRATEHIAEMRTLIERLIKSGHAYVEQDNVLFSVASMPDYGKLARRSLDEMIAGARVEVAPYKRAPMDFVLWKPSKRGEPSWPSPAGIKTPGRPGWHIECSAMSWKFLGEEFDIHGGGIDLVFPHHENEIAQSRCAFHTPAMANYWMHNGFLQFDGDKMAKSIGNFVTIRDLLHEWHGRTWPGAGIRWAMLQMHYREPIDWTHGNLVRASDEILQFLNLLRGHYRDQRTGKTDYTGIFSTINAADPSDAVVDALCDDLNTSRAITAIRSAKMRREKDLIVQVAKDLFFMGVLKESDVLYYSTFHGVESDVEDKYQAMNLVVDYEMARANGDIRFASSLEGSLKDAGLKIIQNEPSSLVVSKGDTEKTFQETVEARIKARDAARKARNFAESDRIRAELGEMGVVLKDEKDGTTWEMAQWWGKPPLALVHDTVQRLIKERKEARAAKNFERVDQITQELKSLGFDLQDNEGGAINPKGRR
jgi:cysteinyl-tRNA synthetase